MFKLSANWQKLTDEFTRLLSSTLLIRTNLLENFHDINCITKYLFSQKMVHVQVRMGSNLIRLNLSKHPEITGQQLIEFVLKKLEFKHRNLVELSRTYLLYCKIDLNEKPINLLERVSKFIKLFSQSSYFIIRKKVLVRIKKKNLNHFYESICSSQLSNNIQLLKEKYLRVIINNQIILQNQLKKLQELDQILSDDKNESSESDYYSISDSSFFSDIGSFV